MGDLFTATKNDAFVGVGSSVWVWDLFAVVQRVRSEGREAKRRLLMVPRAYPKTRLRELVSLFGGQKKKKVHIFI